MGSRNSSSLERNWILNDQKREHTQRNSRQAHDISTAYADRSLPTFSVCITVLSFVQVALSKPM